MKKIVSTRIPAEQANAFSAMGLPEIHGQRLVEVVRSKPQSKQNWRKTIEKSNPSASLKLAPTQSDEEIARQKMLEKAREESALKGYTEGLEKGRKSGHDQGYAEGKNQAKQELANLKQQLTTLLNALKSPLDEQHAALVSALSHMVVNISEAVLHRELNQPESIQPIVEKALQALPVGAGHTVVRLNPIDCQNMSHEDLELDVPIEIVPDKKLNQGDCRLQSNNSLVDYSVSIRFKQAISQMFDQSEGLAARDYTPIVASDSEDLEVADDSTDQ